MRFPLIRGLLAPWKPSSFLDRRARVEDVESIVEEEEVWIVGMIAVVGQKTTWSGQAKAGVEEEEAWIVTSSEHPSPVGLQLGQVGWLEVSS